MISKNKKNKKYIIANWKMTPETISEVDDFFADMKKLKSKIKNTEIIVCPPFVYLDDIAKKLGRRGAYKAIDAIGAQNFFWEKKGSYTGEVSLPMLKNFGVKYVIVGHSERRKYFKVDNEGVNKKIRSALKSGFKVIFCIGESKRDEKGAYLKFLKKEIVEGLDKIPKKELKNLIIAYEPIWAISTSKNTIPDTPESFMETSIYIRRILFFKFGRKIAHETPILYGGSVKAENVKGFLEEGGAQGVLIGRASWTTKTFLPLLNKIN